MKRKIMIIDDEPQVGDAIKTLLEVEGFEVIIAYSGKEGVMGLENEKVDLILLDIMMPEMNGWETLNKIKQKCPATKAKIVMLTETGRNDKNTFELQDNVKGYIKKPFDINILVRTIKNLLEDKNSKAQKIIKIDYKNKIDKNDWKRAMHGKVVPLIENDQEFSIDLVSEASEDTQMKYNLESGNTYLIEEKSLEKSFDIFVDFVYHDIPGLCITRQHVDNTRNKYALTKIPIFWLSKTQSKNNLSPTNLELIKQLILGYLEESGYSIILLDGLEYLVAQNTFSTIHRYIEDIIESVKINKSILLIPIDPRILEPKEIALLERDIEVMK